MPKREEINKNDIINSKYFIPLKNEGIVNNIETNSWFDIEDIDYNILDKNKFTSELIDINKDEFIKSNQIKLNPTKEQKYLILKWMEASRIIYNLTIYYFRKNKFASFITVRPIIKKLFNLRLLNYINRYNVPVHIIDNSINDVCKAYKSAFALLKAKIITHFTHKYRLYKDNKQTIVLEKEDFNKKLNCFYIDSFSTKNLNNIIYKDSFRNETKKIKQKYNKCAILNPILNIANKLNNMILNKNLKVKNIKNELNTSKSILHENIECDSRLTYNKLNKTFILNIPKKYNLEPYKKEYNVCGIDGGYKTFLTIYDPQGKLTKIYNRDETKLNLKKLVVKRKMIEEYIKDKKYNKSKKEINLINDNKEIYNKPINKIKNYYNRLSNKIQNLVKELHYKCANYLCRTYTNIILGKISTKSIISKKQKINKEEKLFMGAISHDKFRTILTNKCKELGVNLKIGCEGYTSMTCGKCANIKEIKNNRTYKCNICLALIDRDANGARNILIKHLPKLL